MLCVVHTMLQYSVRAHSQFVGNCRRMLHMLADCRRTLRVRIASHHHSTTHLWSTADTGEKILLLHYECPIFCTQYSPYYYETASQSYIHTNKSISWIDIWKKYNSDESESIFELIEIIYDDYTLNINGYEYVRQKKASIMCQSDVVLFTYASNRKSTHNTHTHACLRRQNNAPHIARFVDDVVQCKCTYRQIRCTNGRGYYESHFIGLRAVLAVPTVPCCLTINKRERRRRRDTYRERVR